MRNPNWTAVPASLIALAAVIHPQASHAEDCLSAPKGAAPQGQHWYFHRDKTTQRKCWYLHETVATVPAKPAAKPEANHPARSAAPTKDAPAQNGGMAAQASDASSVETGKPSINEAPPAGAAPAIAPPLQSAPAPTPPWPDPSTTGSVSTPDTSDMSKGNPPAVVWHSTDTQPNEIDEAADQPAPRAATATQSNTTSSVVQDLLIIGLAAALAGAASVGFAMLRRRKLLRGKATSFTSLASALATTASAKIAAPHRQLSGDAKRANFFLRFRSKTKPQSIVQSRAEKAPAAPVTTSLVPEQLTMVRPLVAPRQRERVDATRRVRVD